MDNAADHADDEEPPEVPTTEQTPNMQRLLHNKIESSGGDQQPMGCIEQLENAFLGCRCEHRLVLSFAILKIVLPSNYFPLLGKHPCICSGAN